MATGTWTQVKTSDIPTKSGATTNTYRGLLDVSWESNGTECTYTVKGTSQMKYGAQYGVKMTLYAKVGSGSWSSLGSVSGYLSSSSSSYKTIKTLTKTKTVKRTTSAQTIYFRIKVEGATVSGYGAAAGSETKDTNGTLGALATYTVTYNANGGSGSMSASTATYNKAFKTKQNAFTKTGHSFNGWNEAADGSGTAWKLTSAGVYESGTSWTWTYTKNITLYAQWKANTYNIHFDANGGDSASCPADQTKTYGSILTLASGIPVKANHTFVNWSITQDGSGRRYAPGEQYGEDVAVTMYAQWTPNTYTVRYHDNGGTGGPGSQTKIHDIDLIISSSIPTKTGYTFLGWSVMNTGGGITLHPGGSYAINANADLLAIWTPSTYVITYDINNGDSGSMPDSTAVYGQPFLTRQNAFSRTGYIFNGWNTEANGTGTVWGLTSNGVYESGTSWTWAYPHGITLYAQWIPSVSVPALNKHLNDIKFNGVAASGSAKKIKFKGIDIRPNVVKYRN